MQPQLSQRLSGKVAIVSGAGTYGGSGVGNGAAAAIVFAREGAKVVLVDAVQEWADATRAIIEEEGGEAMAAVADVTSSEDCPLVVDAAVERFGGLHILHNNVGGGGFGSVVEATDEDWLHSSSINLMSMINMSRYAVPQMKSGGGGSIINVSSVTALRPQGPQLVGPLHGPQVGGRRADKSHGRRSRCGQHQGQLHHARPDVDPEGRQRFHRHA